MLRAVRAAADIRTGAERTLELLEAQVGRSLDEVETPVAVIDLDRLEANLQRLADSLRTGSYKPPPVRRVEIPKSPGKTRPIGIPTFEDKIAQRAVAMLLEAI